MRHVFITLMLLLPVIGHAHSKATKTVPAQGAVLAVAPEKLSFVFDEGIRLVRVEVNNQPVALPAASDFAKELTLPVLGLSKGPHSVSWRGLSKDGHPVKGSFDFTVK